MLYFTVYKDESGRHYMVSRRHPNEFFGVDGCTTCYPKCVTLSGKEVGMFVSTPTPLMGNDFLEVDVVNSNYYTSKIKPLLRNLRMIRF